MKTGMYYRGNQIKYIGDCMDCGSRIFQGRKDGKLYYAIHSEKVDATACKRSGTPHISSKYESYKFKAQI